MNHSEKLRWMAQWAQARGLRLELEGTCGFGRECVGVITDGDVYPDYPYEAWRPANAYHKYDCVAVLGRGEEAESQLYEWLQWFDAHGFVVEQGDQPVDPKLGAIAYILGRNRYARMVRRPAGAA